jgi:hypothetical protein
MAKFDLTTSAVVQLESSDFHENVEDFVKGAAERGPYNRLSVAPANFGTEQVGNKVIHKHAASGVLFKAGFQMFKDTGSCKWEGVIKSGKLRLDLQGIENGFANWQVQTNKPAGQSKTVAGCLMEVDKCFSQRHLVHALKMSFTNLVLVKLTVPPPRKEK